MREALPIYQSSEDEGMARKQEIIDALIKGDEKRLKELGVGIVAGESKDRAHDEGVDRFLEEREGRFWRSILKPEKPKEIFMENRDLGDETDALSKDPSAFLTDSRGDATGFRGPRSSRSSFEKRGIGDVPEFGSSSYLEEEWQLDVRSAEHAFDSETFREIRDRINEEITEIDRKFFIEPKEAWERHFVAEITDLKFVLRRNILERIIAENEGREADVGIFQGRINFGIQKIQDEFDTWANEKARLAEERKRIMDKHDD